MKRTYFKRTCGLVIAAVMAVSVLAGCKDKPEENNNTEDTAAEVTAHTGLESGDDYAINKINNKTEDPLPGGYELKQVVEEQQGKLYVREDSKSKIIIRAYNYKEDLLDMATWADSACAAMNVSNMMQACDTIFQDPEDVTVCGFDAIRYDTEIVQYQFSDTEVDENGNELKIEMYRLRGRNYFFYSEQDAYVIQFDTMKEDWDEQVAYFEEFVKDLEVTKTEY